MPHHIEAAPSARAKCRGCKHSIGKGELRLGVAVPNAFGDGEALHWFHLECGAERRSAEFLEALQTALESVPETERLRLSELAAIGISHPRWTRPARAERATTGRAKCRHCREAIASGTLRIQLEFVEDGMINPAGFLHPSCARSYLGSVDHILDRLRRTSELTDEELAELDLGLKAEGSPSAPPPGSESETENQPE